MPALEVMSGASFTAVMLMEKVSLSLAALSSPPSLTVITILLTLAWASSGVQLITPVLETLISLGALVRAKVISVPLLLSSSSLILSVYWYCTSSVALVGAVEVILGAVFTAVTLMLNISEAAAALSSPPSLAEAVTLPELVTPLPGVQLIKPDALIDMLLGALDKL